MPGRLLLGFQEQFAAYIEAFTKLRKQNPRVGIEDIDFELGPPRNGRLPCRVIIGSRKKFLCELSDTYPPFDEIRDWMERTMKKDSKGRHHEEVLTLDCPDAVYSFHIVHAGWEESRLGGQRDIHSLSVILAICYGAERPSLCTLCRTDVFIGKLYRAIMECFVTHQEQFNNKIDWLVMDESPLDKRKVSELLYESFRSPLIESYTHHRPRSKPVIGPVSDT